MMLQPDPTQPGLWTNPAWQPGDAGTFAILIGVSAYPYLNEGSAPQRADNTYGLGQLAVSALTTYRLFEWLRDQYLYAPGSGSPCQLAQCWLLLAPTEEERTVMKAELLANTLSPTFDNCRKAMRAWYKTMANLPEDVAQKSRAVFFFSGHGLEVSHEEQILLPTDYLEPTFGSLDDALNLGSARPALMELKIGNQFIFLDACRNDTPELREKVVKGDGVFVQGLANSTNPDANQMVMYATASGQQTFGPRSVDMGISLFGQALLSGLKAERNFALDRQQIPYAVQWSPLHDFVGIAYNDLLKQYKSPLKQRVKVTGEYDSSYIVVTHIKPENLVESTAQPVQTVPQIEERDVSFEMFDESDKGSSRDFSNDENLYEVAPSETYYGSAMGRPTDTSDEEDTGFDTYAQPDQRLWNPFSGEPSTLSAHDFFGRETVTAMWGNARIYALQRWGGADIPPSLQFKKVERTPDKVGYKVTFTVDRPGLYWLELDDATTTYALILSFSTFLGKQLFQAEYIVDYLDPTDPYEQFNPADPFKISGLQVNLSPDSDGTIHQTSLLWEKYENFGAAKAAEALDVQFLNDLVAGKLQDPLSALVASIVLFRLGRTDKLPGQWLENLLNWFPQYADTSILLSEYKTRSVSSTEDGDASYQRIADGLQTMHERGLPITGEVMSYAIREASLLTDVFYKGKSQPETISPTLSALEEARRFFLPGGLFTAFTGTSDALASLRKQWYSPTQ